MIKKLFCLLVTMVLCVGLVGCGKDTEEKKSIKQRVTEEAEQFIEYNKANLEAEKQTPKELGNYDIYVWTDEETGVQYIVYSHKNGYGGMGGITPRLNSDGSVKVGGE